ncbi:MAG: hypothetical protein Q7S14_02580 [bacterium]|nr:hypothetical protein [bacterium]
MESSTLEIVKTLRDKKISLFSLSDLALLFKIDNRQTLYKKVQRLEKSGIIEKLIKGKYLFTFDNVTDYAIANYLYAPSYVSLESALSHYSIITGFPYSVTSITVNKPHSLRCRNKEFTYSKITQRFYFGIQKDASGFLMAEPEKALVDYIYFGQKGLRNLDFSEMDFSLIDRKKLALYAGKLNIRKLPI